MSWLDISSYITLALGIIDIGVLVAFIKKEK